MSDKYIIYSGDFKPKDGGVADYAYNLALKLHREKRLEVVLTNHKIKSQNFPFTLMGSKVTHKRKLGSRFGDNIYFLRRINTLFHKIIIHIQALCDVIILQIKYGKKTYLIVSYYGYYQGALINLLCFLGYKYEIILHGLDILINKNQICSSFEKVLKRAERIIFNSEATLQLFNKKLGNLKIKNLIVAYPGLNAESIDRIDSNSIDSKDTFIFSCVTRLVKRKGVDIAIRIFQQVHNKYPNAIFYIAGKGEEANKLYNLVSSLGLNKSVFFLGYIPDEEKFKLLNNSTFFLMPTHSDEGNDWEGFGISFIEAAYCENIVIGGKHGGVIEAVKDQETGFLFDFEEEKSTSLAVETILQLLENENLRVQIQKSAKRFVSNQFTWNKTLKRI